jgi:hypothetical protein
MRLHEINSISARNYTGGNHELQFSDTVKYVPKMLPGGSRFQYAMNNQHERAIWLLDPANEPVSYEKRSDYPTKPGRVIGKLIIEKVEFPLANAWQVATITISEQYRGMGLSTALYGIALSILKVNLISGSEQTPGGKNAWTGLAKIPGCEVVGYIRIENSRLQLWEDLIDEVMMLGGEYIGEANNNGKLYQYFAYQVGDVGDRIENLVAKSQVKVYQQADEYRYKTGLLAQWTGA